VRNKSSKIVVEEQISNTTTIQRTVLIASDLRLMLFHGSVV